MSHFAKVVDGKVTQVIVAEKEFFDTFVDTSPGTWIQTSYNTYGNQHPEGRPLRGNYAGIGYTYDSVNDVFIAPRPYDIFGVSCDSWTVNQSTWLWEPPTPKPDNILCYWDESLKQWVEKTD